MKKTVTIPPPVAADIASGYSFLKVALTFIRDAKIAPSCPAIVVPTLTHVAAGIIASMDIIERRIPKSKKTDFEEQIVQNDHLKFPEIQRLMARMTPEEQDMMEEIAVGILNKKLKIEKEPVYDTE